MTTSKQILTGAATEDASGGGSGGGNVNLTEVGGSNIALGQATMASSLPVVIASNQSSFTVAATQSGTWNLNNISGTISLPTNAAKETGGNLATIAGAVSSGKMQDNLAQVGGSAIALGQTTKSASLPVVLPSDQTVAISAASLPLPANAAQETGGNLATLAGAVSSSKMQVNVTNSTIAVTESGTWNVGLSSGSNTVGKVDILGNAGATLDSAAGTPNSQAITVQGNASGVALPVTRVASTDFSPATQNITAQDTSSTTTTVANSQVFITGSPTANSTAVFAVGGYQSVRYMVTGTWTGTLAIEQSLDGGTTWIASSIKQTGSPYLSNNFTNNFSGFHNTTGIAYVRVRSTAAMTGTATVLAVATSDISDITITNALPIRDGTTQSIISTLKAGSTASVAGDTSIVVQLNPSQPNLTTALNVTAAQATASNLNAQVVGAAASGASVSGNPVYMGGVANNAAPTAVSSGQAVGNFCDLNGRTIVAGAPRGMKGTQVTTITSSTSATTVVTAGASGVYNDIYGLVLTNSSATATTATLSDGTTSYVFEVPAGDTRGFMLPAGDAVSAASAATAWTVACGTSVASLYIAAFFVKNKA